MYIEEKGKDLIIRDACDFNIEETMECGQCFHFIKLQPMAYAISACGHSLHIYQEDKTLVLYNTSADDFYKIWYEYFDFATDYGAIKQTLAKKDEHIIPAVEAHGGIRLLNQPFFETLISFIISQNKQISHIKQIVAAISKKYGDYLGEIEGNALYAFPRPKQLTDVSEDDFRALKAGFRAPYLIDAVQKVTSGALSEAALLQMDEAQCLNALMCVKGVGRKVAGCVALFALKRRSAFPIDVWIQRIMETIYFDGKNTKKQEIEALAAEKFGALGGYAQQYLFYYARGDKK